MPAPPAPSRKQATPRYLQLADDLRREIAGGEFAGGVQFPTESVLCERYDVSRFTVREALRRLQGEGLIERRRGSGTVVQPAAARGGALHQPLGNVGELLQYAAESAVTYVARGTAPLPPSVAEQVAGETGGEWSHYFGLRKQPGPHDPIAATDVYFHERIAHALDRLDLRAGTLFSQVERLSGTVIGQVTQDIKAIAAEQPTARMLGLRPGAPLLRIIRCYRDTDGRVFEISVSHHPGDRFAYSMHIDVEP